MQFHISTDDVPAPERFDLWNAAVFGALAISVEPLPGSESPFEARFSARTAGPLLNLSFDADGFIASRRNREIAHRQWDAYWIYREFGPGAWFRVGGHELTTTTGDLVIAHADATFETRANSYSHELCLMPKALLEPHLPALGRPLVTRLSGRDGVNALADGYLEALAQNWDTISDAAMSPVTDTLARLIGIACGAAAEHQTDAIRAGRLTEAKRHIDRHLADPDLSPVSVAAALRVSVRALHLLFEPTDSSFTRYVARRRLDECRAALLASPSRPVIDIAFAWGFSSLSGFYRAFHSAFGMAPGDLRAASYGQDAA